MEIFENKVIKLQRKSLDIAKILNMFYRPPTQFSHLNLEHYMGIPDAVDSTVRLREIIERVTINQHEKIVRMWTKNNESASNRRR